MSEPLTVVLITYERTDYAMRVVHAAGKHLKYPEWGWYVSDDGSSDSHHTFVRQSIEATDRPLIGEHNAKLSYGGGVNQALRAAFNVGQLVLMLEDDWELERDLDLWEYACLLMERPDIGMIRMGYLNNGVSGTLLNHKGHLYWALDDEHSKHHSSFAFAGHPALIHRRFFEAYGIYPERWQPGETELHMCWQVATFQGPMIVWPTELGAAGPWAHIGGQQSYEWNGGIQLEEV